MMEGIFTHFAVADDAADDACAYTREQFFQFTQMYRWLWEEGVSFRFRHCDNSAGVPGVSGVFLQHGASRYYSVRL